MSEKLKIYEQVIRKTGYNKNFLHALKYHLDLLRNSKEEQDIESRLELCQYLFSKMFIDKVDLYPVINFTCEMDENSNWPVKPLPSEFFTKERLDDSIRKSWFYLCLKVFHLLDCRVHSVLPKEYHLRVIHKYGVTRILDDLQLMVVLPRIKNELQILEKELLLYELVRVAVSKIDNSDDKFTVYVTVDPECITCIGPIPKLGRITEKDVPSYVLEPPDTEKYSSYSEYLNSQPQFLNPHFYDSILKSFIADPKKVYSFYPNYNGKVYPEELTGQARLKESKSEDVKRLANNALKCLERKIFDDSLKFIEEALQICPKEDPLLSKLYDIRSDIYTEQSKPAVGIKEIADLEIAFKLAPEDDELKKKFIDFIFKGANSCYREKQYQKAVKSLEFILKHDETHPYAAGLLDYIKAKYVDSLENFEEKSILDLQEKKKELLSELKKMES